MSCEKKDSTVVDSLVYTPTVTSTSLYPSVVNTDTMNIVGQPYRMPDDVLRFKLTVSAKVIHPLGSGNIGEVGSNLLERLDYSPLASSEMRDDGIAPDSIKGDNIFTGILDFQLPRSSVGTYSAEIFASDQSGYKSGTFLLPFQIVRLNHAPHLLSVNAPDTVSLSSVTTFQIVAVASDSDGVADIRYVTRTTPSGNVYYLNDNGANGDVRAGDGNFTETVLLAPAQTTGTYVFKFQAVDRSNAVSAILTHPITVIP